MCNTQPLLLGLTANRDGTIGRAVLDCDRSKWFLGSFSFSADFPLDIRSIPLSDSSSPYQTDLWVSAERISKVNSNFSTYQRSHVRSLWVPTWGVWVAAMSGFTNRRARCGMSNPWVTGRKIESSSPATTAASNSCLHLFVDIRFL